MNFIEIANSRYSTKKYDPTQKVPEHHIKDLQNILRLSPSSINSQPWKFIFVSDDIMKSKLAEHSFFNQQRIEDASHLIVFTVAKDKTEFERHMDDYLANGSIAYYDTYLRSLPDDAIRSWLSHQVYLSLGFFLGACASMGIDSTPMEGIEKEKYDALLQMGGQTSLFAVAIGYRDKEDANQPDLTPKSRRDLASVVHTI